MVHNVQVSIQKDLLSKMDRIAKRLGSSRSAFIAEALRRHLRFLETQALEQRHIEGYRKRPVPIHDDEFGVWTKEQAWPET